MNSTLNDPKNLKNSKNTTQYSNMKILPKIGHSPSSINIGMKQPSLYNSTTSFFNMTGKQLRAGAETTNSTEFFIRNYDHYLEKVKQRNKINSTLKTEFELNSLLYKLKNFYSDVVAMNKKKSESLIFLRKTLDFEEFKLNQVIEFQDIELPDEKISVRNFNELKLTKNEVEIQLRNLLKEKQHLDELIKNASEYFKTIEYMCEEEKNRFKEIKGETNIVEEKINNVRQYQRIVDYNMGKEKIKINEEKVLEDKLSKGLELVDEVSLNQKIKNEKLDKIIFEKERRVEELKNRLLEIKRLNKLENLEYQNEIKTKIEKGKEYGQNQKIKEKKIAEIIYCLYLIQNYFFNEEEDFDRKKMMNSNEYKLLESKNFDIFLNKNKVIKGRNYASNNVKVNLPISPAFSEKITENYKLKLDTNENKKTSEKNIDNKIESDIEEDEKEEETKRKEKKDRGQSIFITNLQKKLSLRNFPMQILNFDKNNKEKTKEVKKSNSFRNKKSDIFIYMNKIETKNKNKKKIEKKNTEKEKNQNQNDIKIKIELNNNNQTNNKEEPNNSNKNTNGDNISTKKLNEIEIPSLEELKEKFALIKINRKTLFNYNSKLTSKLNFYKIQFNQYHKKELELEDQRSLNYQKASKVISQNFLAFKQLVKLKPELNKFLLKNRKFIEEVKAQNKKNKIKEMNKTITKMNPINNPERTQVYNNETNNENNKYEIDIQFSENMNLLISSSNRIIMAIKDFFLKCDDYLKQIKSAIETLANLEKKGNIEEGEMQEFLKNISEEDNKLEELIHRMEEGNPKDKNSLVNYIKNLIDYSKSDEELKNMFDINELNTDLLNNFYKDLETKKIKSMFLKQFKLKNFPQLETEFNHFSSNSEDSINHIKNLIKIANDLEKNEHLNFILNQRASKNKRKAKEMTKLNSLSSTANKNILPQNSKDMGKIDNLRYLQKNRIFNGFRTISLSTQKDTSYSELEFMTGGKIDEDDIPDNYTKKKAKKIKKKKFSTIEENIVNKLYSPFLKKTSYLRKLNQNMKGIKSMTTLNCQVNHTLRKRKGEVDILTHQMYIYNNPLVNPDKLANQTYNSLVGLAVTKYNKYKYDKNFLNPDLIY